MRSASVALVSIALVGAGCGGAAERLASPPADDSSNERRLTRAQSMQLVTWAEDFRECMLAAGVAVGPLVKSETRIEMKLPPGLSPDDVVPRSTACGEAGGDPPQRSSLQFRPGKLLLYLPKQCLLDKKVAAS
jgi:hypothetical protein